MNEIRFAYEYYKIPPEILLGGAGQTVLMAVFKTTRKELSDAFVAYDTAYFTTRQTEFYILPNGELLVLLLKTGNTLWTTIRRWTPEKEAFYKTYVGTSFKIVMEG